MLHAKDRFYDVLLEGAGNRSVRSILNGLQARVRVLRAGSLSAPGPARSRRSPRSGRSSRRSRRATPTAAAEAAARHVERAAAVGLAAHA